jgi:transcriptional regulator with XRE-family HTH domain
MQPPTVGFFQYRAAVQYPDPQTYLWRNICALMGYASGEREPSIDVVTARVGVGRGTVQRIKEGSAATRLDSLATIADKLGVPVWRLLQQDGALSPAAIRAATLYDKIKREDDRKIVMHMLGALQRPEGVSIAAEPSSAVRTEMPPADR